jgi:hypothetical protein
MHDFCAGYTFNVIESSRILKECVEVKEEGVRDLTSRWRCRLGSQQHEGVVAGGGSGEHLGQATTRPSYVPALAIHAALRPARGTVAPCWSSVSAGHHVGLPPPGPREHGQRPVVRGAAGEETRRRRLDCSPRRPCPVPAGRVSVG